MHLRTLGLALLLSVPLLAGTFESEVLPILKARCLACHGDKSPQGGLALTGVAAMLRGGIHGAAITPGNAAKSLLIDKLITQTMPPGKDKLGEAEIAVLRRWIDTEVKPESTLTEHDILPILQIRCVACHGKRRQDGGLDLRTAASRAKAIVPGKPNESPLIQRIVSGQCPPAKLQLQYAVRTPTETELAKLKSWIAAGMPPGDPRAVADVPADDPLVKDKDRQFWSFQPPSRPSVPQVRQANLIKNPIDAFLLQKLEAKGLSFAPEASKRVLMRRAFLDLTGAPPTPAEAREFLDDQRPDAYEHLIDRLLHSPRYGERWARHWLDMAGYSDSEGFGQDDGVRRYAWRYRDYVIRALNSDKSYARFLTEQIAGDELLTLNPDWDKPRPLDAEKLDLLAATGFLRTTPDPTNAPERGFIQERMNIIADEVEVLTSSVMGLTVGCARCHNHKYDPIPQRDYYRLTAILASAYDPYDWLAPKHRELPVAAADEIAEWEAHNKPLEAEVERLEAAKKATTDAKRIAAFDKDLAEVKRKLKPKPHVRVLMDSHREMSPFYLLRRGDPLNPGELVTPGVPSVLRAGLESYRPDPLPNGSSGRRLALARWLTQPTHPLTARVAVNHLWMRHFGRGIVASPSNFGRSGMAPSHPELLDWLATEFVQQNWSLKAMHHLMVTSRAYRQTSKLDSPPAQDPENVLLSRMPLRRIDAESLYDAVIVATSRFNPRMFGPPADIEVKPDKEVVVKGDQGTFRRAVYVLHRRQTPVTMFEVFDQPPMTPNCIERRLSNVSTQALQMMNGTMVWEHARYLAGRLIDAHPDDRSAQLADAWWRILARDPAPEEKSQALASLDEFTQLWKERLSKDNGDAPVHTTARWNALATLCHTLLNSAEFAFID
jgi:hypothetical protein